MEPYNLTHISLGMEWGYHLLSPGVPYTSGVSFDDDETLKAVVLLTDGRQTMDGWGPGNVTYERSVEHAEFNLVALCQNMKADGIRVITVSFDLADSTEAETEERLSNCSGDINAAGWRLLLQRQHQRRPRSRLRRDPRPAGTQDVPRRIAEPIRSVCDGRAKTRPSAFFIMPSKKRIAGGAHGF